MATPRKTDPSLMKLTRENLAILADAARMYKYIVENANGSPGEADALRLASDVLDTWLAKAPTRVPVTETES